MIGQINLGVFVGLDVLVGFGVGVSTVGSGVLVSAGGGDEVAKFAVTVRFPLIVTDVFAPPPAPLQLLNT